MAENGEIFYFRKLEVYKAARKLTNFVYDLLEKYPQKELYALCNQMRRAVVSVASNIAEGMSRNSDKEKLHFLDISYGSLMEVVCQMDISLDRHYISEEQLHSFETQAISIQKMLFGLSRKISERTN